MKFLIVIMFLFISTTATCEDINLQWSFNKDADSYVVYKRTILTDFVAVWSGSETQATIYDLNIDEFYCFAVKAFNSCGNSSDFSEEICKDMTELNEDQELIENDYLEEYYEINEDDNSDEEGGCFIMSVLK